jgi:hypothetical protein
MFIALVYPIFAFQGVLRIQIGQFGLNKKGQPIGTCTKNGCIELFLYISNQFLYFGVMTTLMSAFACRYNGSTSSLIHNVHNANWNSSFNMTNMTNMTHTYHNTTDTNPALFTLVVSQSTSCFDLEAPSQLIFMALGGLSLLAFYPLATTLSPNFQFQNHGLDIKYEQKFLILEHQADLLLAGLEVFLSDISTETVLVLQIMICLFMGGMNHYLEPCLVYRLNIVKTIIYFLCAYTCVSVLIFRATLNYLVVTIMIGLGWLTFPIIGWWYHRKLKRTLAIPDLDNIYGRSQHKGLCWCCKACAENCCADCFAAFVCCTGCCGMKCGADARRKQKIEKMKKNAQAGNEMSSMGPKSPKRKKSKKSKKSKSKKKKKKNISDGSILDSSESSKGVVQKGGESNGESNGESSGEKVVDKESTMKRSSASVHSIPRALDSIVEKKKGRKEKSNKKSHFSIPSP